MRYIYCYENKINHHKYVGQTSDPKSRYSSHETAALNPNSKDYNCLFHRKIRQYGLKNFNFYILEEINSNDSDYIDERECFWIEVLNTWCRYGNGYNEISSGKQYKRNLSLTDDEIRQIQILIKTTELSFVQIANQFNTYCGCISKINKGIYGFDQNEQYPLRITRDWREVPQEVKQRIAEEIINTKTPLKDLAKKFEISEHLINQINNGQSNLKGEYKYPLRKTNTITKEQEELIYKMLKEGKKNCEIAKEVGVSRDTVSRRKKKYKDLNL